MKDPSWKLAGFIVDDPLVDIVAIRLADVFFFLRLYNVCLNIPGLGFTKGSNFLLLTGIHSWVMVWVLKLIPD